MNVFYEEMDHYDTYTYLVMGPISFCCALLFIVFTLRFKESRAFPGNLLIIISVAELGLCVHWFWSAINTKYIMGREVEIKDNSPFCVLQSFLAFGFGSTEFYTHMAFMLAIITMLRNTMKKIKFTAVFALVPILAAVGSVVFSWHRKMLGKNLYGTCSVKQTDHISVYFLLVIAAYVTIGGYALVLLRKFINMQKTEIIYRDNFYKFYSNYIILIFVLYMVVGLNYYLAGQIKQCAEDVDLLEYCHSLFFLSRLTNNVKIFIPLWSFLVRIKDPFLRKLASSMVEKKIMGMECSQELMSEYKEGELMILDKLKELRQGMAKTIIVGL